MNAFAPLVCLRRAMFAAALVAALAIGSPTVNVEAQELGSDKGFDREQFHGFVPGSIVLSGTVYVGNADTVTPGEVLPHGCLNTGPVTTPNPATVNVPLLPADQMPTTTTTAVTVSCGYASDNGIPLIFDEVVTGFRLAYGGAQEYYGVVPDLCTLGKVIGGGFPLAAIAGRAEIMKHFDRAKVGDENFLVQIGTLSGNPVAAAAGLATLAVLKRPGAYEQIHATGRALMKALGELLVEAGIAAQISGEPPLFDVVFSAEPVRDYRTTLAGDAELMRRFNALLRERGILKGESKYYISLAHTDADIKDTIVAWESAIAELKH